jgi:hypothetical protein
MVVETTLYLSVEMEDIQQSSCSRTSNARTWSNHLAIFSSGDLLWLYYRSQSQLCPSGQSGKARSERARQALLESYRFYVDLIPYLFKDNKLHLEDPALMSPGSKI